MKILFLAPRMPLPADTGAKIRTFNILKQLALHCSVDLVCFSFEADDQAYIPELEELNINVSLVPMNEPGFLDKVSHVLYNPLPFSIAKYYSQEMEDKIVSLIEQNNYDAVHVDHVHMTHYHHRFKGIPCFVDEHNVEYKILERCVPVESSWIKRKVFIQQAKKMKAYEGDILQDYDACFAVSEGDQSVLQKMNIRTTDVYVIANGVDTQFFNQQNQNNAEEALVFTGSMDWLPNEDAVVYFCQNVLPTIWKTKPELKFYVVGKNPSPAIQDLGNKDKRIVVTGRVDDVRDFMAKAKVFVVPIRIGGGTRLKILEAMSMSMPVVSTSIGAEGIQYKDGEDIVISDEPEHFAQQVCALLDDDHKCSYLGKEARYLVTEHYDWKIIGERLRKIYAQYKK